MNKISFFTPVSCGNNAAPLSLRILSTVDSYFYRGGKRAILQSGEAVANVYNVKLEEGRVSPFILFLKEVSYCTVICPIVMLVVKFILRSTYEFCISDAPAIEPPSSATSSMDTSFIIRSPEESEQVRKYPGDLTEVEKPKTQPVHLRQDNSAGVQVNFHPDFFVSIRAQDIFKSGAQVIVNAANAHLGGGEGIDGAIHTQGGASYIAAHQALKAKFKSNYPLGYAAMISSGALQSKCRIDDVIVVAGPQGNSTSEKENQLYSCYYNSLVLANHQNKMSIAFPSISTGLFGFPQGRAAAISLRAIHDFIRQHPQAVLKTISIHFLPNEQDNLAFYN